MNETTKEEFKALDSIAWKVVGWSVIALIIFSLTYLIKTL